MIYKRLFQENIVSKTEIQGWINTINSDIKILEGLLDKVNTNLEFCKKLMSKPYDKSQNKIFLQLDTAIRDFESNMLKKGFYYNFNSYYNLEQNSENKIISNFIKVIRKTYKERTNSDRVTGIDIDLTFYLTANKYNSIWEFQSTDKEDRKLCGFRRYSIEDGKYFKLYFTGEESLPPRLNTDEEENIINHPHIDYWLKAVNICLRNERNKFNQIKLLMKKAIQRLKTVGLYVDTKELKIMDIKVIVAIKNKENEPLIDNTVSIVTEIIESLTWFKPYASSLDHIKILDDKKTLFNLYGRLGGLVTPYAFYTPWNYEVSMPIIHKESEIPYYKGTIKHELFHHVFNKVFKKNKTLFEKLKMEVDKVRKTIGYPTNYAKDYFTKKSLVKKGVETQYNEYCAEVMATNHSEFDELKKIIIGMI